MDTLITTHPARQPASAALICTAALVALAVAMGVGRFAFTPLFPVMLRDGLLGSGGGALLAASNYLGYLIGALLAGRIALKPASLLALGLAGIVAVTGAMGLTVSLPTWTLMRFLAGMLSAWALVAISAWGFGWLARLERQRLAGAMFAGVGLGIAATGIFCMLSDRPGISAAQMWLGLALLSAVAAALPLLVGHRFPAPGPKPVHEAAPSAAGGAQTGMLGLVVCYSLFGFGYILPATYLPALARLLVSDPLVFGWAWPVFGGAAAVSTLVVSWWLMRAERLRVWAAAQLLMAAGVLLPAVWEVFASIVAAAVLVGGTFMVITMVAMQAASARAGSNPTAILARMTAGFAFGQLMGPVVSAVLGRVASDHASAIHIALMLAAAGLVGSAAYLWRVAALSNFYKE